MTGAVQTLRLEKTVFHRSKFIREVRMRQPTQADIDEAAVLSDSPAGRGIALLSIICNLEPSAVIKISDDDLERLQALYDGVPVA